MDLSLILAIQMHLLKRFRREWMISIDQASQKGSEYFRERLVVDVTNLVDQTHDSQFLTTNKAFESVYNYLARFEIKLRASNDYSDVILLPSVRETKQRVKRFLD